jgi:uncharacterized protein (DUF2249 family)
MPTFGPLPSATDGAIQVATIAGRRESMESKNGANEDKAREINLLDGAHEECHVRVMRGLDEIGVGGTALIIADHDVKPVLYQYQSERGYTLKWNYEQDGSSIWKIRVTKSEAKDADNNIELLDVRHLPPPLRHKTIFDKFDSLVAGKGFLLVNDHDPKPVYYELRTVRGDVLIWEYVEQGPRVWRVKVVKTKDVAVAAGEPASKFDVRQIPPAERHHSIFHRFGTLRPGEAMELINDHDPRPLYMQFQFMHGHGFSWTYLEQGPAVWRIRISKTNTANSEQTSASQNAPSTGPAVITECAPALDVRPHPPAERHRLIFEKFDNLKPGAAFILINDHDPKPLYYQFAAEHEGAFSWNYLERGPVAWRVAIGKTPLAS